MTISDTERCARIADAVAAHRDDAVAKETARHIAAVIRSQEPPGWDGVVWRVVCRFEPGHPRLNGWWAKDQRRGVYRAIYCHAPENDRRPAALALAENLLCVVSPRPVRCGQMVNPAKLLAEYHRAKGARSWNFCPNCGGRIVAKEAA